MQLEAQLPADSLLEVNFEDPAACLQQALAWKTWCFALLLPAKAAVWLNQKLHLGPQKQQAVLRLHLGCPTQACVTHARQRLLSV